MLRSPLLQFLSELNQDVGWLVFQHVRRVIQELKDCFLILNVCSEPLDISLVTRWLGISSTSLKSIDHVIDRCLTILNLLKLLAILLSWVFLLYCTSLAHTTMRQIATRSTALSTLDHILVGIHWPVRESGVHWSSLLILLHNLVLECLMTRVTGPIPLILIHHVINLVLPHLVVEALILQFHHVWHGSFAPDPVHFSFLVILADVAGLQLLVLTKHHLFWLKEVARILLLRFLRFLSFLRHYHCSFLGLSSFFDSFCGHFLLI